MTTPMHITVRDRFDGQIHLDVVVDNADEADRAYQAVCTANPDIDFDFDVTAVRSAAGQEN